MVYVYAASERGAAGQGEHEPLHALASGACRAEQNASTSARRTFFVPCTAGIPP